MRIRARCSLDTTARISEPSAGRFSRRAVLRQGASTSCGLTEKISRMFELGRCGRDNAVMVQCRVGIAGLQPEPRIGFWGEKQFRVDLLVQYGQVPRLRKRLRKPLVDLCVEEIFIPHRV